jgi:aspartyl protease family protein
LAQPLPLPTRLRWPACALAWMLALAGPLTAAAQPVQSVQFSGSLGNSKALLLIDGVPQTLAVGERARGVTLRRLADGLAEVEVAGKLLQLRLGGTPGRLAGDAGPGNAAGSSIVLAAGPGGHFTASGQINGRPVQFLVDTGATSIALSQSEANRLGLDWQRGQRAMTMTANGPVPVVQITLSAVRIGDVEVANVAAVVIPAEMPVALLGNSFLNRFSMRRDADLLRLDKKP